MSQTSAAGGKPPSGSGLTMDDVDIVGRDMKGGGGSKGGSVSQGSGGSAPPAASTTGKNELALSGSLAKSKLAESLAQNGGAKIEGGGLGAAAGAAGKFQDGAKLEFDKGIAGKMEGGGLGAAAGAAGKFQDGFKLEADKGFAGKMEGGGMGAGAGAAGMMDKIKDAAKFGEEFKDFPGGMPGAEKFGDAGSLGGKLAGLGGDPNGGKFGAPDGYGGSDGKDPAWKEGSHSATDGFGKKDDKFGVGGGKKDDTGSVDSHKKPDSTGGPGDDDKKTEKQDSSKTEMKKADKSDSSSGTKETGTKEKEKSEKKGIGGPTGPGDPDGLDGSSNPDPMGFGPNRERNPMPTGEAVGIDHGEGDRGSSNRFSVQGSINARINPGSNRDSDYETRQEGPSLLWELQHYGIDRPETGAVESEAAMSAQAAAAASDRPSGSTGQVAGTVRAEARAEDLAAEELPGGSQIPPGAGD